MVLVLGNLRFVQEPLTQVNSKNESTTCWIIFQLRFCTSIRYYFCRVSLHRYQLLVQYVSVYLFIYLFINIWGIPQQGIGLPWSRGSPYNSVGLWFSKIYHYNRCIITSDVHCLRSDREHLFTAGAYPWTIDKIPNSMGCRVVFEHFFSLIHRSFFLLSLTAEK